MSFMERLRSFMYGRYGFDQLGKLLFAVSLVFWGFSIVFRFTPLRKVYFIFWLLNTVLYVFAIFRILSKNTYQRTVENERYLRFRERFIPGWRRFKTEKMDKAYVFRRCPHCGSKLRLKRIRGRHTTKCPRCGTKFTVRIFIGEKN